MQKRGLSTIVVTLIIILVSLVAVGIIWVVVKNVIQTGSEGVSLGQFSLSAKIKDVSVDNSSNNVTLTVRRNAGKGDLIGINFVFSSGTDTEVIMRDVSLNELEERKFNLHLSNISVSDLISVSIVPLIKQNEEETLGIILDKYNLGGSQESPSGQACIPTSNPCGTWVCGNVLNGTCGEISCGNCTSGYVCNASGRCVSSCTPLASNYCSAMGYQCGYWGNNTCSGNLSCGTCGTGYNCIAGRCVANTTGNTIYALSCSYTDVQAAINSADYGDRVVVPAGSCTWSSSVNIPSSKKITLQGAGIDLTIINSGNIYLERSGSRLTGFTFNEGGVNVDGSGWRVDHCKFSSSSFSTVVNSRGYVLGEHPEGLVDNCIFYNSRAVSAGTAAMLNEGPDQHYLWAQPLNLGSGNGVVYIENNIFIADVHANAIDGNYGGRYVFRYNNLTNIYIEAHSVQGNNRAHIKWEIYGNRIHTNTAIYYPFRIRGGTGVIFNNTLSGPWTNNAVAFDNVRSYASVSPGGLCNGTSSWDGNEDSTGWPCRDQIGRSTDVWLWTTENPYPPQLSLPAYVLGNIYGGGVVPVHIINSGEDHIKPNRDYYADASSFDGTSGVGIGTLANRPSTCTTGVAYWASDVGEWNSKNSGADGQFYKCISTNNWQLYYTPYAYPHPLALIP